MARNFKHVNFKLKTPLNCIKGRNYTSTTWYLQKANRNLNKSISSALFEGRSPKISIIRWSVHVSLTATGRNYEQFRWYWPWLLIIIYKFDQIDEADCMFIFQIKHQYSFWIIAHILFNALLRVLTWNRFSWPRSSHSVT